MDFCKDLWKRYRHFIPVLLYMLFYMSVFTYTENRTGVHLHLLSSKFDAWIPFCEIFILPYLIWFFYVALGVFFFGITEQERKQFWLLCTNLCIGMTVFLIISLVWPNGHTLRPAVFPRENIFTDMVAALYRTDTSTNILPSIHVFNSIAIHIAVAHSETLKKYPAIKWASLILCILIVASTVFLKQHSMIDVFAAFILNYASYQLVYQPKTSTHSATHKYRHKHWL